MIPPIVAYGDAVLKKEAEERTLTLTKDHLISFLREHPGATYEEWIEDLVSAALDRVSKYFALLMKKSHFQRRVLLNPTAS